MVCPQKEKRLTRKIFGAIMKKIQKRRTHREEICSRHDEHDGNVHVPHVHALLRLFPDVLSCELIFDRLTGWKYKRSNRKLSGFLFFVNTQKGILLMNIRKLLITTKFRHERMRAEGFFTIEKQIEKS